MGEDTLRRARMEPPSRMRWSVWTASSPKTGLKWVWRGLVELSTIKWGSTPRNPRRSPLDWSARYLRERWEAGERNGTVLWEELKAKGYTGSSRSVYRRLAKWREHPPKRATPASPGLIPRSPFEDVSPGQVIEWMLARPETLSPKAQEQLDRITQMDEILAQTRELTHGFLHLIRSHSSEGLESWLKDVRASHIR